LHPQEIPYVPLFLVGSLVHYSAIDCIAIIRIISKSAKIHPTGFALGGDLISTITGSRFAKNE
jgi:hypothetical protein